MFLGTDFPFPWMRRAPATEEEERSASQAAALRVFLHAAGASAEMGMAAMPMAAMPLQEALAFLRNGKGKGAYTQRAFNVTRARLAVATYAGGGSEDDERLRPSLVALLGAQGVKELEGRLPPVSRRSPDTVRRAAYDLLTTMPPDKREQHVEGCGGMDDNEKVPLDVNDCGGKADDKLYLNREIVAFDPRTLITTVQFCATSDLSFDELVRLAEPREWEKNNPLFWRCSKQVVRDAERKDWVPAPPPSASIGAPWEGAFFEEVDWSWNMDVGVVGAFDVILNIKTKRSQPTDNNPRYEMWFCLHQCLGSMLFGTVMGGGIEVDDGFYLIKPNPERGRTGRQFCICLRKRLRYSSRADRRAYQGPPMSEALLNLMAPSLVSLWLHGMMDKVYSVEVDKK